jgi:sulfate adenylyltransferase
MISPHGNKLINKLASENEKKALEDKAEKLTRIDIAYRNSTDCEMIANGVFSPLEGFMNRKDAESVINKMELANGTIWSVPIVLPVSLEISDKLNPDQEVALYDEENTLIAIMRVEDKFTLDLEKYCQNIFKTTETQHPGVKVVKEAGNNYIGGEIIKLINRPQRENIDLEYYRDPALIRKMFEEKGWKTIVAFQTRNPIHRAHEYIIKTAMEPFDGALIHPLVGETKSDDIPADVRMKCYEVLVDNYFSKNNTMVTVLPTTMRYAGPREAVHHMIMRKNYGCTHMIIGRDHAGVGNYYGTYEAQEFVSKVVEKLGITPIMLEHSFYCLKCESMASQKTCPHPKEDHVFLSGTKVRELLREGNRPPKEFSRVEVADILIEWATNESKKEAVVS